MPLSSHPQAHNGMLEWKSSSEGVMEEHRYNNMHENIPMIVCSLSFFTGRPLAKLHQYSHAVVNAWKARQKHDLWVCVLAFVIVCCGKIKLKEGVVIRTGTMPISLGPIVKYAETLFTHLVHCVPCLLRQGGITTFFICTNSYHTLHLFLP